MLICAFQFTSPTHSWKLNCSVIIMLTTWCPSAAKRSLPISYTRWCARAVYYTYFWTKLQWDFYILRGFSRSWICGVYCRLTHVLGPQTGLKPASSQCWSLCILVFSLKSTWLLICWKLCTESFTSTEPAHVTQKGKENIFKHFSISNWLLYFGCCNSWKEHVGIFSKFQNGFADEGGERSESKFCAST